jgi:hypothetical protein
MKITLAKHALDQLREREIGEAAVRDVITQPEQVLPGHKGRKIAQKRLVMEGGQWLLRVIYEEHEDELLVVTTYLTTKIEKYWRRS